MKNLKYFEQFVNESNDTLSKFLKESQEARFTEKDMERAYNAGSANTIVVPFKKNTFADEISSRPFGNRTPPIGLNLKINFDDWFNDNYIET